MAKVISGLSLPLTLAQRNEIRKHQLVYAVTEDGRVTYSALDSKVVGVGRSPRQALEDWLAKSANKKD